MIYVTGDTHGKIERLSKSRLKALHEGDTLIVLGDFGFIWNGGKKEEKILKDLGSRRYNICFLDGTHENFSLMERYSVSEWKGGKVQKIYGNLYHLMRGQIYNLGGKMAFVMGGGESPDIEIREKNSEHARDSLPRSDELAEGAENLDKFGYKVDYVFTHEPPAKVKGFLMMSDYDSLKITVLNSYFDEMSEQIKFDKWYFGSMHEDKFISRTHTALFKSIVNAETGEKI